MGASSCSRATFFVFRDTKPGLLLDREAISIVSVIRTQRFAWELVSGFMGERSHDEARMLMVLEDDRQIPLPGTLDPAELDPYGDEGQELSAADQLNQLKERAMAGGLPKPAVPVFHAPDPLTDRPTRKELRSERKALRAALKAVRLTPEGTPEPISAPHAPTHCPMMRHGKSGGASGRRCAPH